MLRWGGCGDGGISGHFFPEIPHHVVTKNSNGCSDALSIHRRRSFVMFDAIFSQYECTASVLGRPTYLRVLFFVESTPPLSWHSSDPSPFFGTLSTPPVPWDESVVSTVRLISTPSSSGFIVLWSRGWLYEYSPKASTLAE